MANPNPPTEHLKATQFKPGSKGNPGGMTSEMRRTISENAEKATRIRAALLDQLMEKLEAGEALDLAGDVLKLIKDTEDRGLGAPKQTQEIEHGGAVSLVERVIVDPKASD